MVGSISQNLGASDADSFVSETNDATNKSYAFLKNTNDLKNADRVKFDKTKLSKKLTLVVDEAHQGSTAFQTFSQISHAVKFNSFIYVLVLTENKTKRNTDAVTISMVGEIPFY